MAPANTAKSVSPSDAATIAYYTVVEDERTGWTGGLLQLNSIGRPIEFQCTLPVRPSRTQEILFGATLRDHLIGEVIGPLLVSKCRTPIQLLCCDQPEALRIESIVDFPVALVDEAAESEEGPITDATWAGSATIKFSQATLRVGIEQIDRVRQLARHLANLPDAVEPFQRIREAIKEAHLQITRATVRRDPTSDAA